MATPNEPRKRNDVAAVAGRLMDAHYGTGPLAELRRLNPAGALAEPALQRLLARHVPAVWLGEARVQHWALLIHAMALAAPDHLRADVRLGAALFEAGLKELRFVKLLDATGDELLDAVPRAVRFLVAKGQALNAFALSDLIQSDASRDEEWSAAVRRRIAADYYGAEFRAERPATTEA